MRFLVEHVTPGKIRDHGGTGVDRTLRTALPFTVEVNGPEARTEYGATCNCREVYRLTDAAVNWLRAREMLKRELDGGPNPVVCRCMGRIVSDDYEDSRVGATWDFRRMEVARG